jgi:hypothetical protein
MTDIYILNEMWAQDKSIYFSRHVARLQYFTYHLVLALAPNYKQHILSPAKVRKVCYSLAELHVKPLTYTYIPNKTLHIHLTQNRNTSYRSGMIQPSKTFQELFYIAHFWLHRYSKRTFHPNGMNMKAMQMEQLITNDDGPQTRLCTYPWLKESCKLQ